jgi:hypothetical protein
MVAAKEKVLDQLGGRVGMEALDAKGEAECKRRLAGSDIMVGNLSQARFKVGAVGLLYGPVTLTNETPIKLVASYAIFSYKRNSIKTMDSSLSGMFWCLCPKQLATSLFRRILVSLVCGT